MTNKLPLILILLVLTGVIIGMAEGKMSATKALYGNEAYKATMAGRNSGGALTKEPALPGVESDSAAAKETVKLQAAGFYLKPNFPNPFNPVTTIPFVLDRDMHVTLVVYNILGQKVKILTDETLPAGSYEVKFEAGLLPSGFYFCQLKAGEKVQIRKMDLLK